MIIGIVCFENICLELSDLSIYYSGYGAHSTEATIPFQIHIAISQNDMSFKKLQSRTAHRSVQKCSEMEQSTRKQNTQKSQANKQNIQQYQQNNTGGKTSAIIFGTSNLYHFCVNHVFMFLACIHSFVVLFLKQRCLYFGTYLELI